MQNAQTVGFVKDTELASGEVQETVEDSQVELESLEDLNHKRSHPVAPTPEKASPESKVPKTLSTSAPSAPQQPAESVCRKIDFDQEPQAPVPESLPTGSEVPTEKAPKPAATQTAPSPVDVNAGKETKEQELLRKALERIGQLECQLSAMQKPTENKLALIDPHVATPQNKLREDLVSPGTSGTCTTTVAESTPREETEADEEPTEPERGASDDLFEFPNGTKTMTHDAIRMRLRRLCEVKAKSKRCHVDEETVEQYKRGGESREWLEIALVEALQKIGPDNRCHKKLRVLWLVL